ncbi:MAG: dihydropteroate synthase [Rickettsiales bacterium]
MSHTKIAGVLNLTPDSFSDGGQHVANALARVQTLLNEGADIIDIGAQSTRPGAERLSSDEEWKRLSELSAVIKLIHQAGKLVSVDTIHSETARRAIALGVDWINDVSGFSSQDMIDAVRDSSAMLVLMHALDVPADPAHTLPADADPIEEIRLWAERKIHSLAANGVATSRFIFDPGIGFGKTPQQSLEILLRIEELKKLGLPLLIGHSRKSFLKLFTDKPASERDDATLGFSAFLMDAHVDYLRVHNVSRHVTLRNFLPSQK